MWKIIKWVLIIVAIVVVMRWAYVTYIEPEFEVKSYDEETKKGVFSFGGTENTFGPGEGKSVKGHGKWVMTSGYDGSKAVFDLYNNGKLVRRVHTIE